MAGTRALLGALALLLGSCASTQPPLAPMPAEPPPFEDSEAWRHLEALVGIGPRVPGSEGAAQAREYVRAQLEELGIEVREQHTVIEDRGDGQPLEITNLIGVVPGESDDLFLLAAALDTRGFESFEHRGAAAASGPALLLELAGSLVREPLPYTVRFAFLGAEVSQGAVPAASGYWSSRLLVNELADEGMLDRVRLAIYFGQVADAELTIARDLMSHRSYRDAFFKAARSMGHEELFPSAMGFDSVSGGHTAFLAARMRRVVIVTDPRYGGDQPPGIYHHTEQDTLERLSAENLDAVGRVSEQALRDISGLLVRVDRFARRRSIGEAGSEFGPAPDTQASDAPAPEATEPSQESPTAEVSGREVSAEPAGSARTVEVESAAGSADETGREAPEEGPR